jgi:hypothetical protein
MARGAMSTDAPPTDEHFERARRLALELAGIELHDRHRELIGQRWARLAAHGRFDAWLGAAEEGDRDTRRRLIELLTTNVTGFFRHPGHFRLAAEHARWVVHRRGPARLWSVAAATGEEPYSLAMAVIDVFGCEDPIAKGEFDQRVPFTGEPDETGALARSVDILKGGAAAMEEQRWVKASAARIAAEVQRATAFAELGQRLLSGLVPALGGGAAALYVFDTSAQRLTLIAAYGAGGVKPWAG